MSEPKENKQSTFQAVMTVVSIAVVIVLGISSPVFTGALRDIKENSKRLNGLVTQQALTQQNRVYMEGRFDGLEGKMENVINTLNNFIISYDQSGRRVGHTQPRASKR